MQKISYALGLVCFVLTGLSIIFTYLKVQELGFQDVVTGSAAATAFFFFTTGVVLIIMGKASLPKLHFDEHDR